MNMQRKDGEELNRSLMEYENLEKQLEVVLIQKHQLQIQQNEIKHALEELKKANGQVYRSIGSIMVHTTKDEADKELKEKSELVEVKLSAITKQEEKLRATVMDTQKRLQEKMKGYGKPQ
ncbi:prefoldin subunit beta [Candidatus Micrarchaeota archaeon]|nr:prefoldin subunit beta [Candidatus Micrarchaeota archaeon]